MKELCSIFIGQAGVQIASAVWEMFCLEHGISRDGTIQYDPTLTERNELNTVFQELTPRDVYIPRAVLADLEPSVIDEIRDGAYKNLFNPETLIAGMEDAAGNFARGYYTLGGKAVGALTNATRRLIEKCENFQGIIAFSALGGGTGSGLLSMFQERASLEFAGRHTLQLSIIPSDQLAVGPVEVYNCVHHLYHSSDHCDLSIMLDNSALYNMCTKELAVLRPTYTTVNRIIGPVVAGVTSTMRFKCYLNANINEYLTNLIPFPAIHYPMVTLVPFCTNMEAERNRYTTQILTHMVFKPDYRTVSTIPDDGVTLSTCLTYRGQHSIAEVAKTIEEMREERLTLVDWCPTAFKVAYTPQPPTTVPGMGPDKITRSLVMITNNTVISDVFNRIAITFTNLFSKRAFLHWYVGEGMEMDEFNDALEKIRTTASDIAALEAEGVSKKQKEDDATTTVPRKLGGSVSKTDTSNSAGPRRLITRGTGNNSAPEPPIHQLMNYQECPIWLEKSGRTRPRLRKGKDRTPLKDQLGDIYLTPKLSAT
ncbi:unnamed protein product [Mesocestoides corti]|uniref:Tubulin alpha chain n=1 Tax=Mesocestoides corti TaxID=53468 RepID=A0A0R3U393_MESCO|nr:unnamed protein product [Mesocestoides corti]